MDDRSEARTGVASPSEGGDRFLGDQSSASCSGPDGPPKVEFVDKTYPQMTWYMTKLAAPVVLDYLLQIGVQLVSMFFAGHISTEAVAATALASTFCNISGVSVIFGLGTALDTLCSQAYGAKQYEKVGFFMQRGLVVLSIVCVPISVVWLFSGRLLLVLGQGTEVAALASIYCRLFIPGLFMVVFTEVLKKFYMAAEITKPLAVVGVTVNLFAIFSHWLFINVFDWGYTGLVLAVDLTYVVFFLQLLGYAVFRRLMVGVWTGFSREAFRGWSQFFALALPGLMMMMAEWVAFEACTVMVGVYGGEDEVPLASQGIVLLSASFAFMVPFGLGITAGNHVGNALGAGRIREAKQTAYTVIGMILVSSLFNGIFWVLLRRWWGSLFTDDPAVIDTVAKVLPVMFVFGFFDGTQGACSGVLRGCGRQRLGAITNAVAYYPIALPIVVLLTFTADLGVMGTWIGMTVGVAFSSLVFLWGIAQSDWPLLAEQARKRAAGESSGDQVGLLAGGSGGSDDEESVAGGGGALDAMSRRSTASSSEKSQAAV